MQPFLKWLGSKRWAVDIVSEYYKSYQHYRLVDLTLGSGAIPLAIKPARFLGYDINPQLIQLWNWVKVDGSFTIPLVSSNEVFYSTRDTYNYCIVEKIDDPTVPQLLYLLCRTSFNGLHRSSKRKAFNAPWGKYKTFIGQTDLTRYKQVINTWEFRIADYQTSISEVQPDDFILFDPPYYSENNKAFTSYYGKFTTEDAVTSATLLSKLKNPVIAFNSSTRFTRKLYEGLGFSVQEVTVPRRISCTGDRTPALEIVATLNM